MILARLRRAIQEQNWFAVVLEVCIVIVGVVIGFQITAWGNTRADRNSEQIYLHQLAADLRETEQHIVEVDAWLLPYEAGSGTLQRYFYEAERPSADSLLSAIHYTGGFGILQPTVGTAEALVATGDLALIRTDSLRSAITAYLTLVDGYKEGEAIGNANYAESFEALRSGRDLSKDWELYLSEFDALPTTDPMYPLPTRPRRTLPPIDVEAFLSDPIMQAAAFQNITARLDMRGWRENLRGATLSLLDQVEAELDR